MPCMKDVVTATAGLICLGLALAAPMAAADEPACAQWRVDGNWSAIQSNGPPAVFTLSQNGSVLLGKASYAVWYEGGLLETDDLTIVFGSVDGTIKGDNFDVTVYWNNGTTGVYTGKVGPQGRIEGSAYDKLHPQTTAIWHSDGTALCPPPAAATPAASPGIGSSGSSKPTVALGRVQTSAATTPTMTICESAKSARARNSPAAPGLEAQCRAQPAPVAPVAPIPGPILDEAAWAKRATRGEALANQDPLALELRSLMSEGAVRRGFDYGMAAAEGHTEPGPGKQAVHDALHPDEKPGFEIAVQFSLDRNSSAGLAAKGASIASADTDLAATRQAGAEATARVSGAADAAVFYKLGFDVATAIFGDPALGAMGNTATGPGSMKIRGKLSPGTEQSGFDDATAFHLRHDYGK